MELLTIGSTSFEIEKHKKLRDKIQGTYMKIWIPETRIDIADLRALLDGNKQDIIITDASGNEIVYSGYATLGPMIIDGGKYIVEQFCDSELAHLLNEARAALVEHQKTIAVMGQTMQKQSEELVKQGETITKQNETITEQKQTIEQQKTTLEAMNQQLLFVQMAAVDLYEKSLVSSAPGGTVAGTAEELPEETGKETVEESEVK